MSYDHAREQLQVVLDTWKGWEYLQIHDNRLLLERVSNITSTRAEEFVNKAIENTLNKFGPGNIQLLDGNLGHLASTGGRHVRPKRSFF